MMKKLLLSLTLSFLTFFVATAQNTITGVTVVPTTITKGPTANVEVTVSYNVAEAVDIQIIGHVLNDAGNGYDWGDELSGNSNWHYSADQPVAAGTGSISYTVPVGPGAPLSSDVTGGGTTVIAARINNTADFFGEAVPITIEGTNVNFTINDLIVPTADVELLSEITLTLDYNSDTQLEDAEIFLLPRAIGDPEALDFDDQSDETFRGPTNMPITIPTTTGDATLEIDLTIANDIVPTADLVDQEYVIFFRSSGQEIQKVITIVEPSATATLSGLTLSSSSVEQGATGVDFTVDYTAAGADDFSIQYAIVKYNINTSSLVFDGTEEFFPAEEGISEGSGSNTQTVSIPGGLDPSADLPAGIEYRVVARINVTGVNAAIAEVLEPITITATTSTLYLVDFESEPVGTVLPGDVLDVSFEYTAPDSAWIKVAVEVYDGEFTVSSTLIENNDAPGSQKFAPASMFTTENVSLTIPTDAIYSEDLSGNLNYKITIAIFDNDNNSFGTLLDDDTRDLTIDDPLGFDDLTRDNSLAYPNPASDVLFIDDSGRIDIYDMLGNNVLSTTTETGRLDVSTLEFGSYVLVTESGKVARIAIK